MCGIAGVIAGGSIGGSADIIRAMTGAIRHRGPDAEGFWQEGPVFFGHRRLSIIDLSAAAAQPMLSSCERYVLTYNGEIYNHADLRASIAREKRVAWRGASDTESLLEALALWGVDDVLLRANGMFAFALWDRVTSELVLARDAFGEKPLYYAASRHGFAFASEFRSLERHPAIDTAPDPSSVATYLARWFVPPPYSIALGVAKLPDGCVLRWSPGGEPRVRSWWSITDAAERGRGRPLRDPEEAVSELETLLADSVRIRLMSDVPLGALLSGGIDSTLVASFMQQASPAPVRTFSIGFTDDRYNEAPHARAVATYLGTHHTESYVTDADALALVPHLGAMYDEPFADSSQIPTALVCAMAREHVTVVLTGDGGDELFGGYARYRLMRDLWRRIGRWPARGALAAAIDGVPARALDWIAPGIAPFVPRGFDATHLGGKLKRATALLRASSEQELYVAFVGGWPDPLALLADPSAAVRPAWTPAEPSDLDSVERMMWWDTVHLLPNDLLVKVDRASMAVGLEGRMPLLDRRVAECAWRMPTSLRMRDGVGKWPLRAVLQRHVPAALVDRPKMGFGVPLDAWLRDGLKSWAEDLLSPARLQRQGLLNPAAVAAAWRQMLNRGSRTASQIWSVLMLQTWLDARGR